MPIRALVVDDSAVARKVVSTILDEDPEIEVVGIARDPYDARDKIKQLAPDVITLDVEMPRMDGITFLRNLMRLRPTPVVMVSTLTQKGADITMEALRIGAVDFVPKPTIDLSQGFGDYAVDLRDKVRAAARAKVRAYEPSVREKTRRKVTTFRCTDQLIAIGSSTGGTEAVREILEDLPTACPAIVVAQHIPPGFAESFAERLDRECPMRVHSASDGQLIQPGNVYIAPGEQHLEVRSDGARWRCKVHDGERVNRHRPSVDVLFHSVAKNVATNAIGVMLTGMGNDGAQGMLAMKQAGAPTIAQDEATSVVWGMPGSAVKAGAVDKVLPLHEIPTKLQLLCRERV